MVAVNCRKLIITVIAIFIIVSVNSLFAESKSTENTDEPTLIGKEQQRAVLGATIGNWSVDTGTMKLQLKISDDGKFAFNEIKGDYSVDGKNIKLHSEQTEVTYQFDVTENQLTLTGGDLSQELKLSRLKDAESYFHRLFEFSPKSMKRKLYRALVIVAIVVAGRVLVALLRIIMRFIVYCDWGPLGFVYRSRKNRAMTIHSLVLNLLKYIIYIVALGFILTELGINYTAYLASLSVIGLAIGFGSQGLVQDMVTGFFILFEGQFDVGDMVEIPPYIGIVDGLGLRMTKLRNYFGQKVIIPNRNIAAVGNYAKGAQETYIDVAISSNETAKQATGILEQVSEEIGKQFEGTILGVPKVLEPVSLATNEHFIRIHTSIWPQQQWVIEQQLVPRIKEILKNAGLEVPADRVAVFYHPRQEHPARKKRTPKKTSDQQQKV